MESKTLKRVFKFKDKTFADIDPTMPPEKIVDFYAAREPELLNSNITGPVIEDDNAVYTISHVAGTKG